MPSNDLEAMRDFSIEVVRRLRAAGYIAYWAGGCVRDRLLGVTPKDYDVATNATPDRIREVFGRRKTLPIGAAFGVITVLGPKHAGQVEVATFREDAGYSDGRHPDSVRFSDAEADAQRRDFTINGMFYDPIADETIDYVGGEADLAKKLIRAIGDPAERVREDKLRMLRAIRFAAVLDFELEEATFATVQRCCEQIDVVSPERISQELRRMLANRHRGRAVALLDESQLLIAILPELAQWLGAERDNVWAGQLQAIECLRGEAAAEVALALMLRCLFARDGLQAVEDVGVRLRLSRDEIAGMTHSLEHESLILGAADAYWPTVQRVLAKPRVEALLSFSEAIAKSTGEGADGVAFCRAKLGLPETEWNPPTLINGHDLQQMGLRAGPKFKEILDSIRDQQLLGELTDREQALAFAAKALAS